MPKALKQGVRARIRVDNPASMDGDVATAVATLETREQMLKGALFRPPGNHTRVCR
jgi:hypothetical protein